MERLSGRRILWRAQWHDYNDHLAMAIFERDEDQNITRACRQVVMEPTDGMIEPCFTVRRDECQQIIDELWRCGLRPSDYASNDKMSAVTRHLEDMRQIVFKKLAIEKPGALVR